MAGKTIAYLNVLLGANNKQLMSALDTSEKRIQRFGADLQKVGKDLSLRVTAPLAAIGAVSVATTAKFSDSMLKVKALSGATAKDFERLEGAAKKYGATTRYSATETADAMGYMALAGFNTNQTLAATPAILSLAAASATDLAAASDIVTDTMSAFNMEAGRANEISDLFANTQAKSNTSVLQLGEAFKYSAANAASANQSITDTSSVLAVFANAGIKGSSAGTAFNAMLRDLKKSSEDGSVAIGKTKVALYDSEGQMRSVISILGDLEAATSGMTQMQKDAALGAIFKEEAIRGVNTVLNAGTKELVKYQAQLGNSTGAAQAMAEEMESGLGGSLRRMKSSLESIQVVIGDNLAPTIDALSSFIQRTAQSFGELDPTTQKNIVQFGLLAAAIPPVLFGLGKIITLGMATVAKVKLLSTMLGVGQIAATGFGAALYAAILPITAVVAALYALYKAGEYFNKSSKINSRITAEIETRTKNLNTVKNKAVDLTKELNSRTGDFNKLSQEERKNIIATTQAKILDLETTLRQEKALALLTARKAMELTQWEKFIANIKGFGMAAQISNHMAAKSAEKYNEALGEQKVKLGETEDEIQILKDSLMQIEALGNVTKATGEGFESLGESGKKTSGILTDLQAQLKKIKESSNVLGKEYDHVGARIAALSGALIDLRVNGVSPLSDTYNKVEADYIKATDSKHAVELSKKLAELTSRDYTFNIKIGGQEVKSSLSGIKTEDFIKAAKANSDKLFEANMMAAKAADEPYRIMLENQKQFAENFQNQWSGMIESFSLDIVGDFAEAFGRFAVLGKSGLEGFTGQVLGSFGKFLVQMGKMGLVYSGFAAKIKEAFANPAVGIAASIGLIAVGGAMSAMAANINSSVGGGSSGGSGGSSYSSNFMDSRFSNVGSGTPSEPQEVEFKIKGDTLVGILQSNNRFKQRF